MPSAATKGDGLEFRFTIRHSRTQGTEPTGSGKEHWKALGSRVVIRIPHEHLQQAFLVSALHGCTLAQTASAFQMNRTVSCVVCASAGLTSAQPVEGALFSKPKLHPLLVAGCHE
jgi:hypothetical protein